MRLIAPPISADVYPDNFMIRTFSADPGGLTASNSVLLAVAKPAPLYIDEAWMNPGTGMLAGVFALRIAADGTAPLSGTSLTSTLTLTANYTPIEFTFIETEAGMAAGFLPRIVPRGYALYLARAAGGSTGSVWGVQVRLRPYWG